MSKIEHKELLSLATEESYLILKGKIYKQVIGITMGFSVDQTLLMLFLYSLKRIGYKVLHLTLSIITTGGMLMIFLICLAH